MAGRRRSHTRWWWWWAYLACTSCALAWLLPGNHAAPWPGARGPLPQARNARERRRVAWFGDGNDAGVRTQRGVARMRVRLQGGSGSGGSSGSSGGGGGGSTTSTITTLLTTPPPVHDCDSRVYVSPTSGRAFMASVVGLAPGAGVYGPGHPDRLPVFRAAWAAAWPGLAIQYQPTFANSPKLLGYGVAAGYYLSLVQAAAYLADRNASCDYHVMFEDDGLPFNGTTWPGGGGGGGATTAEATTTNDLDARLDALEAAGGTALALGGHTFWDLNRTRAAEVAALPQGGIVQATMAYGAYGLAIKCSALPHVVATLHAHLRRQVGEEVFEGVLWGAFKRLADQGTGTGVHVSVPLLVDHAHGFSATWNKTVDRPFEGNATFW